MEREVVKISALKAAPYNPRQISGEALAGLSKSLERWGVVQEVVANRRTGYIVGGHQRVTALKKMGVKEVPVVWVDLDEVEEKALNVALNNPHISGEFDDTIAGLLTEIRDGIGPDDFAELKLDDLLPPDATVVEGNTDPDDVPEAPEEPITKPGDLWILGSHRLLCGDSTNIQHVERLMGGEKADMVFTDPPYGVSYEGGHNQKKRNQIKNDALQGADLTNLFADALGSALSVTAEHAAFYIWFASGKSVETFASFSNLPLDLRAVIQWYKVRSGLGAFMAQYIPNCEPCIYAFKSGCSPQWFGPSDEKTVWELQKETSNDFHPTQKPVELPRRALRNSSKPGQLILDLFGGSGSTLIACEQDHRHARLMELDPAYCDVIVKRWEDFTGKKATLEASDATG